MCFYVSTLPSSVCWLRWQANICNWNNENRGGYREEDEQFGAPQAGDEWNKKRWIFVSFLIIFQWRHGIGKIVHFFNEKSVTSQQEDTQKCKKKAFCTSASDKKFKTMYTLGMCGVFKNALKRVLWNHFWHRVFTLDCCYPILAHELTFRRGLVLDVKAAQILVQTFPFTALFWYPVWKT